MPEGRQVHQTGLETARQHGAVGADQAIHPIRLARTPFLVPKPQQGLEVPIERLRCGDGYSIFAGRFDLLQETTDLLPRIGAERVEIDVPVVRQRDIGAERVVDPVDLDDLVDLGRVETCLREAGGQQPPPPLGYSDIVEMKTRPVHLPDGAGKGWNDLVLGIGHADDAGIVGTEIACHPDVAENVGFLDRGLQPQRKECDVRQIGGITHFCRQNEPWSRDGGKPTAQPFP
jgi:hypothetical protein